MQDIALIGKMGSGKDTVAQYLVKHYGYTRIAFADPVREMALDIDPWMLCDSDEFFGVSAVRLSELVDRVGWDRAKREYPEVRRVLQQCGTAVRKHDRDYWFRIARDKLWDARNHPVVFTDTRFINEAFGLHRLGIPLVRVVRPAACGGEAAQQHVSETELDDWSERYTLTNDGTPAELGEAIETMLRTL